MNEEKVYLAWQNTQSRKWTVVGQLTKKDSEYVFNYTNGAKATERFVPFPGMSNLSQTYHSEDLFPLFKNRLLSDSRPEYPNFIKWLGLDHDTPSPLQVLGRSGGVRATDNLQTFCDAHVDQQGNFEHFFFAHGLRYLSPSANERVSKLSAGDDLKLAMDAQNPQDKHAVLILADHPTEILGYIPRYLCESVHSILARDPKLVSIKVEQVSLDAPTNYRLMCKLTGKISTDPGLSLMSDNEFQVIES